MDRNRSPRYSYHKALVSPIYSDDGGRQSKNPRRRVLRTRDISKLIWEVLGFRGAEQDNQR